MMVAESKVLPGRRWTYSELQALGDERRVELHSGELVERTAPKYRHQRLLRRLLLVLEPFVAQNDAGEFFYPPHDVYVTETDFYEPDLSFVAKARFAQERIISEDDDKMVAPPDLIVEIISPSTGQADRVKKMNAYAAFGVRHYWIFDPAERTLQAYKLDEAGYRVEASLSDRETFEPSLFPGLRIPLAQVFNF